MTPLVLDLENGSRTVRWCVCVCVCKGVGGTVTFFCPLGCPLLGRAVTATL